MVNLHKGLQDSDQYAQINGFSLLKTTWLKPKNQKKKKKEANYKFWSTWLTYLCVCFFFSEREIVKWGVYNSDVNLLAYL